MDNKEKGSKYGRLIDIKSCINIDIEIKGLGYKVTINNISSDIMKLLFDRRNKVRLVTNYYFLYAQYSKIQLDFFLSPNSNNYTTYEFFVSSVSKNKVSLIYTDDEDIEEFITGEELLKKELEKKLEKEERENLLKILEEKKLKNWNKGIK